MENLTKWWIALHDRGHIVPGFDNKFGSEMFFAVRGAELQSEQLYIQSIQDGEREGDAVVEPLRAQGRHRGPLLHEVHGEARRQGARMQRPLEETWKYYQENVPDSG